jgi:hypothetical protein
MRSPLVCLTVFLAVCVTTPSAMASCVGFWGKDNAKTSEECFAMAIAASEGSKHAVAGNLLKGEYVEKFEIYPETFLTRLGNMVHQYGEWLSRHPDQPRYDLQVTIKASFVDKYRNTSVDDAMVVTFSRDEMQKINWKNLRSSEMLDFATVTSAHPTARKLISVWCVKYPALAPRFCRRYS